MHDPRFSVIIPALNEERYITKVIDSLKQQTFKDFETIVVDGGSTDGTVGVSDGFARVIVERRRGVSLARNIGARHASGSILLFLDADTCPSRSLLERYSEAFGSGDVVAASCPIEPLESRALKVRLAYRFFAVWIVKLSMLLHRPALVGSNLAVRRDVFEGVGGFNTSMVTYEDWDLSCRVRKRGTVVFIPDEVAYTSARRVLKWGVWRYLAFSTVNAIRYRLIKNPKITYEPIR